jgi:hypothetical protein
MALYAGANHQPIPSSNSSLARRRDQFPPAPKSVRVVSVFSEAQPAGTPEVQASATPEAAHNFSWALWLIAITVFLGLVAIAVARSQGWNQLGI